MRIRISQSATIFIMVLAFSFMFGQSAQAGIFDWFKALFSGPSIQEIEPKAGAQEGQPVAPSFNPRPQPPQPPQPFPPQPSQPSQPYQPSQPSQPYQPSQPSQPSQPFQPFPPQPSQPSQPPQPYQLNQPSASQPTTSPAPSQPFQPLFYKEGTPGQTGSGEAGGQARPAVWPTFPQPSTEQPTSQPTTSQPSQPPQASQPSDYQQGIKQPPFNQIQEQETQEQPQERDWVDPREIQQVSREIKDLQRQIKELTKQATKQNSTDEIAKLNEIINQLNDFAKNIKTPPTDSSQREVIQNFRDGQYWEIINGIRAKIEFPRQVKNLEKEILKVEKKMKQKAYQVAISEFPSIKEKLDEIKAAINEAKANFEAGDLEEALQSLRFQEDIHSGDINCVLDFLPYIYNRTKKLKDGEIKQAIEDILNELFEMIRQGDFREACQGFNNIRPELEKIMQAALSSRQTINPAMQAKIDKLQSLFNRDSATSAPTKPEIAP